MAFQVCVRKRGAGWTVAYQSTLLDANFDLAWGDALKDWTNTDVILRDTTGATFATRYAYPVFARTGNESGTP